MPSDKLLSDLLLSGKKKIMVMNFRHGGTCVLNLGKSQNQKYVEFFFFFLKKSYKYQNSISNSSSVQFYQ